MERQAASLDPKQRQYMANMKEQHVDPRYRRMSGFAVHRSDSGMRVHSQTAPCTKKVGGQTLTPAVILTSR